jgi:hypothetical protein
MDNITFMNPYFATYVLKTLDILKNIPDRRFGKNTMYPMPRIVMTALAALYSRAPSFRGFLRGLGEYRMDPGVQTILMATQYNKRQSDLDEKIPTDNHVRFQLDGNPLDCFREAISEVLGGILVARAERFSFQGRTVLLPYFARHYSSPTLNCVHCVAKSYLSPRSGKARLEYFHAMMGCSLLTRNSTQAPPQLPPEFLTARDFPGIFPGEIHQGVFGDQDPSPQGPEVFARWLRRNRSQLESLNPLFILQGELGNFKALSALENEYAYLLVLDGDHGDILRAKAADLLLRSRQLLLGLPPRAILGQKGRTRVSPEKELYLRAPAAAADGEPEAFLDPADIGRELWERRIIGIRRKAFLAPPEGNFSPFKKNARLVLSDLPQEPELVDLARWAGENYPPGGTAKSLATMGFGLKRHFGHGRETLAEILASLNLLALNLYTLEGF